MLTLRDERDGKDTRILRAHVDGKGLHLEGQDLGPGTAPVSDDGEYEWFVTYAPADLPRVVALLDGEPGEDVLEVLKRWVGRSYELEARLRASDIPFERFVWSG